MVTPRPQPPAGLARFIVRLGGISPSVAAARADAALEALKEPARRELAMQHDCLRAWNSLLDSDPPVAVIREVHRIANELAASGGLFGLASVGLAAKSLCETIDAMEESGHFDLASVDVHVQAVQKLWDEALSEDDRNMLLERLNTVIAHARAVGHLRANVGPG